MGRPMAPVARRSGSGPARAARKSNAVVGCIRPGIERADRPGRLAEQDLVDPQVEPRGVLEERQAPDRAAEAASRAPARPRRRRRRISPSARPASTKPSAAFGFIVIRPGTTRFRASMPSAQPIRTIDPDRDRGRRAETRQQRVPRPPRQGRGCARSSRRQVPYLQPAGEIGFPRDVAKAIVAAVRPYYSPRAGQEGQFTGVSPPGALFICEARQVVRAGMLWLQPEHRGDVHPCSGRAASKSPSLADVLPRLTNDRP